MKTSTKERFSCSREVTSVLMRFVPPSPVRRNKTDVYDILFRNISGYAFGARNVKKNLKKLKLEGINKNLLEHAKRRYAFITDDQESMDEKLKRELERIRNSIYNFGSESTNQGPCATSYNIRRFSKTNF